MAGREFESAEEADEWLTYLAVERNQNIDEPSLVSINAFLIFKLIRGFRLSSPHFSMHASGEIFLAWNGLSIMVQMSTRKMRYDLKFQMVALITLI